MTADKPRICLFFTDYRPISSGVGNCTQSLAQALARRGYPVDVVTCRHSSEHPAFEVIEGVRVHRIMPWARWGSRKLAIATFFLLDWPRLLWTLAKLRPDYVFGMMLFFGCMVDIPKRLLGFRTITCAQGSDVDEVRSPLQRFTVDWAIRHCDIVCATNTEFRDKMKRRVPRQDIQLLPNAIDASDIVVGEPPFAFDPTVVNAVAVGRMVFINGIETKGHSLAIRAMAKAQGLHLHFIGDGPYRATLEALTDELGLRDRVFFHGQMPHAALCGALARADVLLFPSQTEGLAKTVIEAAFLGCPIITTPIGGQKDYYVEGESALFVTPGDADSIAHALNRIAASPELRHQLAAGGRAVVKSSFTYEAVVERFEQILSSAGRRGKE